MQHFEYVFPSNAIDVYDMDNGQKLVKTIALPAAATDIRGAAACPSTHTLYVSYGHDSTASGGGVMLAYDLVGEKILWTHAYPEGIDSMAITPSCKTIYMPVGEASSASNWDVLEASTGNITGAIEGGAGPHNTIVSLNGAHVYMGPRNSGFLTVAETDLLRTHADGDPAGAPVQGLAGHAHLGALVEAHALRPCDGAGKEVGDAEEARDECRPRLLVELRRAAELLDPARVHDRDPVRHRHRLLLVVRDVDEGNADVVLDRLQLELHLLAELQVEGSQRLVEQEHTRLVDERTCERDALLLAAGELARLPRLHSVQVDQVEDLAHTAGCPPRNPLRRMPKATFSKIVRWGKSA